MKVKAVAIVIIFATVTLPAVTKAVDRFGVACVTNMTDAVIFFRYESGGEWHTDSLRPGFWKSFAHKYDKPNQNHSPELDIQFDSDLRAQKNFTLKYKLQRRAATGDNCDEGAQYQFQYDARERSFIDLKRVP